jgi:hypothetical protein
MKNKCCKKECECCCYKDCGCDCECECELKCFVITFSNCCDKLEVKTWKDLVKCYLENPQCVLGVANKYSHVGINTDFLLFIEQKA